MLAVSQFLSAKQSPFILGAFFGRYILKDEQIQTYSSYKKSKFVNDELCQNTLDKYEVILNQNSKSDIWKRKSNNEFIIQLQNDLGLSSDEFFVKLLQKIFLSRFFLDNNLSNDKKSFLRGFFECRGSIDTTRPLLASDYFYNSSLELKRLRYLIDNFFMPSEVLNFNFRELQSQFISGENKRNTQLRINLFWYLKNIGLINEFKALIVKSTYKIDFYKKDEIFYFDCQVPSFTTNSINERLDLYLGSIYDKKISDFEISQIRKKLDFNKSGNDEFARDSNIIKLVRFGTDDKCAACSDVYDIKDRSFKMRLNDRYYTEIHHCISVGKNKSLDVLENLSKLCPTCHRALKKGSSNDEYQKVLIAKILKHNLQNLEFASIIFDSKDLNFLIDKIQQALK